MTAGTRTIVLGGPIGVGHQVTVPYYAREDEGCFCSSYTRTCVWDAPIVASELADRWDTWLLGNTLGDGTDANALRRHLRRRGVRLLEIRRPRLRLPQFDFVITSARASTRTWYSTIVPPLVENLLHRICRLKSRCDVDTLYLDHWTGPDVNEPLLAGLENIKVRLLYYNLGDIVGFDGLGRISKHLQEQLTIFQASLKRRDLSSTDLIRALRREWPLMKGHHVIITRGGENAFVYGRDHFVEIPVPHREVLETVGAGAYLSARIIEDLYGLAAIEPAVMEESVRAGCDSVSQSLAEESLRTHIIEV